MKLLQETTSDWTTPTPNHIYIFGSSSMYAIGYIKAGEKKAQKFTTRMRFDKKRRTFKEVRAKDYDLSAFKD
jgi:hypothetical protein